MPERSPQLHERVWQFRMPDPVTDSTAYFEKRAKEMAQALNYRLVAISQVTAQPNADARLVSGKALVEGSLIARRGGRLPNKRQS